MAKFLLVLLLINYLSFEVLTSEDAEDDVAYLEQVDFHYFFNNGTWTCGGHICSPKTRGCHVQIKNKKGNELYLTHLYHCMPYEKHTFETKLSKQREVSIDLFSYVGATKKFFKTVNKVDGTEIAEAVIEVNGLDEYKKAVAADRQLEKNLHEYGLGS